MRIETWTSDNNKEEIHHFLEGEQNVYLFGFNAKLLGEDLLALIRFMVESRIDRLERTKRE